MFTLAENHEVGKELRATVVDALKAAMSVDEKIIALDADLGGASKGQSLLKVHQNVLLMLELLKPTWSGWQQDLV